MTQRDNNNTPGTGANDWRARELARLSTLRKLCVEAGQDPQQRAHAQRLITRIDAFSRRLSNGQEAAADAGSNETDRGLA